jgi:DNA repair protein RadD
VTTPPPRRAFVPRPFQERVTDAVMQRTAVQKERRTMVIAPTGAGKTMLIGMFANRLGGRGLVIQHREELVQQNRSKFALVNPKWPSTTFTQAEKRFARLRPELAPGAVTFAMVQTLVNWIDRMPPFDWVIVDECHHGAAPTWLKIIEAVVERNPDATVIGVTATPNRSDKKGLGPIFYSVADIVSFGELIDGGYLVPPVAFVADVGISEGIANAKRTSSGEYDMFSVAEAIDNDEITDRVIDCWLEQAGDRKTIVFCATVAHAEHVTAAFNRRGIPAGCVIGEDDSSERQATIRALETGSLQVIVNVATLTEGFDNQLISCVILLRPSSFASVAIQMIGRGLRAVDPDLYPGVIKTDCIVMDFGSTLMKLGGLEQLVDLAGHEPGEKNEIPPSKLCWNLECGRPIPAQARICPLCGAEKPFVKPEKNFDLPSFTMRRFDLVMKQSRFRWLDLPEPDGVCRGRSRIASAGDFWVLAMCDRRQTWHAFAGVPDKEWPRHLVSGDIDTVMSASDEFLATYGDAGKYGRNTYFQRIPATEKQLALAGRMKLTVAPPRPGVPPTMYDVGCRITAEVNREKIRKVYQTCTSVPG